MKRISKAVILTFLAGGLATAQEFRATISGRVADKSGAVVPHAAVVVTNIDTGAKTQTTSNESGEFTVPFLLPGKYSVSVGATGFEKYLHQGLTVQSGEKLNEDVTLAVGAETEQVNVTADTTLLQTATSTAGQVLTPEEIENYP